MTFTYVASPYSHPDETVRNARYRLAMRYCAGALRAGHWVYSPIVHCHEMALAHALPTDHEFWLSYDFAMLEAARGLEILMLPDWEESQGVNAETDYALALSKPIHHIPPNHEWLRSPIDHARA